MATVYDIVCEQGATLEKLFNVLDENDAQLDLSAGYTARMQVRKTITSGDVLLELTTENGRIELPVPVVGPPAYNMRLIVDAATTAALAATPSNKNWFYDLELVTGSVVMRKLKGRFKVSLETTR